MKTYTIISIHAPPRGATFFRGKRYHVAHFNSRPSARGDTSSRAVCNRAFISIHAPPRGATSAISLSAPRTRFQFTPLREGRRRFQRQFAFALYFNSRPSARGDDKAHDGVADEGFQFTPLREGRRQKICNFCKSFVQPLQISMA